jgi:chemosensory pili system protein ChpA (sensor histidine kinase/response regulator)
MLLEGSNASTVLTWVRPDLDKHLGQLRSQIEHLAGAEIVGEGVINTAAGLEQLKYTFEALVLKGATLVVEEMILVCDELKQYNIRDKKKAYGAMMDAIVVLPSYLDRLQAGHHDLPVLLLPVINELRDAYGANIVSEATLFTPVLDVPLPELERPADQGREELISDVSLRMQRQWETALLKWLQDQENVYLLEPLQEVCEAMQARLNGVELRRLWWIAEKVIGGLLDGVTDNDMHLRRLFARLHLALKTLAEGGEEASDEHSADSLAQALLFHIAQAKPGSASVDDLRKRFNLQDLVPDRDVLIRARGAVTGRNRELYKSLGAAVRDELALVKDALDLELRTGQIEQNRRSESQEALFRLKDTLMMMGLANSARSMEELIPAFQASENPDPGEGESARRSLLMDLAGELIRVESDLEEQIITLGEPLAEEQEDNFIDLPQHEVRRIKTHLLDETVFSLHQVQEAVHRHFSGEPEADFTGPLDQIAGALELISEKETASLALRLRNALSNLLSSARSEMAVEPGKLEALTDAVAAFELYLAGCRDQQSNRERFLDILKDRLERLPVSEHAPVHAQQPPAESARQDTAADEPARQAMPPQIDAELLGVFLEEYEDVVQMLDRSIPSWLESRIANETLTNIRRGFHTLKGSGRMVGAHELGDFAWYVEDMLNRLLEQHIQAGDDLCTALQVSVAALPAIKSRLLQEDTELSSEIIEMISDQVRLVAEGKPADWNALATALPACIGNIADGRFSSADAEPAEPDEHEILSKEFADNLAILRGLMERLSVDRDTVSSEEEIRAVHTIAGISSMKPIGLEDRLASAMENFLTAQRNSGMSLNNNALWAIASALGYFEDCLAILQGDGQTRLADDADGQMAALLGLAQEYAQAPPVTSAPSEQEAEEPEAEEPEPVSEEADEDSGEVPQTPAEELEQEEVDPEILSIFLEEATDILERCDSLLNTWRDNLSDLDIVRNLQREFHTFKGGSRMAGLTVMGELSHSMETLLENMAGHLLMPSEDALDLLEQSCDRLNAWTEQANRGEIPVAGKVLQEFKQQIEALTTPRPDTVDADHAEPEPASVPTVDTQAGVTPEMGGEEASPEEPQEEDKPPVVEKKEAPAGAVTRGEDKAASATTRTVVVPKPPVAPASMRPSAEFLKEIPEVAAVTTDQAGEATVSQQIRVNAELLDSLVNSAGEISIFRSLLEQNIVQIRDHLKEFDVTTARLREQFRKLEIETETQIRSRYQQEIPDTSEEFDPLEMDRFSSLQHLSRSLSESVSDLLNLQELLDDSARKSEALLVQQSRVSKDLQEGLMQTRMVHFGTIAPRLRRIIRTAAKETKKKARLQLRMTGGGDQLDRNVLERVTAPLEHLLRNAMVHGIEKPADRKKLDKPVEGQISITVAAEATEFVIHIEDDGAGIDLDAVRKKAIEKGLVGKNDNPGPQQLQQMILSSGFSTSKTVTALAGRGVGMDVVNSEIKQVGGSVEIESEQGKGSCFTIRIPFSLAVMQAIGVMAGEHRYLIPVASVAGVTRIMPAEYEGLVSQEAPAYEFAGESYAILELEPLLGEPTTPLGDETISMLMIKVGEQRAAFRVSQLLGHREIVVKPVGPQISSVPGILGGTITGDGQVVVIIDAGPLIRQALLTGARPAPAIAHVDSHRHKKLAMVVDDSITMRRVTTRVLENNDYDVITARDGIDATEQLQDRVPDILLLDIEMPRMDGYQVAEWVRADARLRHIPIIMITSRAGGKHRERGIRAGANAYLSKPYKELELVQEVERLLEDKD